MSIRRSYRIILNFQFRTGNEQAAEMEQVMMLCKPFGFNQSMNTCYVILKMVSAK